MPANARNVVQTEQVRAELLAYAPDGVGPGQTVWLGLQLQHQPQWHTYWKNPGDSGLPTTLAWTLPPGVTAGEIAWPTPHKIAIGSLANLGFEGTVLLPVPLSVGSAFAPGALADTLEVLNLSGNRLSSLPADLPAGQPLDSPLLSPLAAGLPSELLQRRPDILAAEHVCNQTGDAPGFDGQSLHALGRRLR